MSAARQDFMNIRRVPGNGRGPLAEAAVSVDSADPFGEELAFGLLLLIVLAFHFQDQRVSICQAYQVIRPKLTNDSSE